MVSEAQDAPDWSVVGLEVVALAIIASREVGGKAMQFVAMFQHKRHPLKGPAMFTRGAEKEIWGIGRRRKGSWKQRVRLPCKRV